MENYFIGVDVSKMTVDISLLDGTSRVLWQGQMENTKEGVTKGFHLLKNTVPQWQWEQSIVCLEHTGIYIDVLVGYLEKQPTKVCVENAVRIKRSMGLQRGKSDKADAFRIAKYALLHRADLRLWNPSRPEIKLLKELSSIRKRLIKAKNALEVPLNEFGQIHSKKPTQCKSAIAGIKKDIQKIDAQIKQLLNQDEQLKKQTELATSVPGVGPITAAYLIVTTNEFKDIKESKKFSCYSGIAPFEHSSGSSVRGKTRVSKMGNQNMKTLLHLGALSAIRVCPEIKQYYDRKIAEGKHAMNVINAVRNKLISRVFACIRDQKPYENNYVYQLV